MLNSLERSDRRLVHVKVIFFPLGNDTAALPRHGSMGF